MTFLLTVAFVGGFAFDVYFNPTEQAHVTVVFLGVAFVFMVRQTVAVFRAERAASVLIWCSHVTDLPLWLLCWLLCC